MKANMPNEEWVNQVRLVGRLHGAQARVLPSGDELVTFRVIVDRPARQRRASRTTVDTIDCTAWSASLRRRVLALEDGAVVEVSGCLQRRFWKGAQGAASRTEVEVAALRRC